MTENKNSGPLLDNFDTTNVHYIDEYPELAKRVWLRRLHAQRQVGEVASSLCLILSLPEPPDTAS